MSAEEDVISATITAVTNGTFTQTLQNPQTIKISKSAVGYAYPLEYLQNFNRQPYEEYRRVDKCNAEQCWDENLPEAKKKYLWGICCLCGGKSHHRGINAKCGPAVIDFGKSTISLTRFPTYSIGFATMDFNVYVDISSNGKATTRLTLNPNNLVDVNKDKTVIARLQGDLVSYKMPPSFPSVFLSHPTNPTGINPTEWLIIDRRKYTETGAVCDLIGTSYQAFVSVNSPCTKTVGYCLAYQLGDYIKEEHTRLSRGLPPSLSVTRYGAVQSRKTAQNIEILWIPLSQTQNSIIVLELSADNLKFMVNRSPGKITSVKSSSFEALSHDGYSDITVVNTGELVAAFTLGAVIMTLNPNEPKTQHFELNTESSTSQTFNCSVRLRDSEGVITDAKSAYISVTATQFTNVSKMQSEGASVQRERVRNGGGIFGFVGSALGGILGFTKNVASGLAGALGSLGLGIINSIFGSNVGALIRGFFHGISSLLDWILGGFGIGKIFGNGQCPCASVADVLCILANFCFAKMIGWIGFLLVLAGVVASLVYLHKMGLLVPLVQRMGCFFSSPLQYCKKKPTENGEDEEADSTSNKVQSNSQEPYQGPPQLMAMPSQQTVPWAVFPSQTPYGYEQEDVSSNKVQPNREEPYQELPQSVRVPDQKTVPWAMLPSQTPYGYEKEDIWSNKVQSNPEELYQEPPQLEPMPGQQMVQWAIFPSQTSYGYEEEAISNDKVQSNFEEPYQEPPQLVAMPTQLMAPWTMLPSQSPCGYEEEDLSINKVQSYAEEPYQEPPQWVPMPDAPIAPWTMLPPQSPYGYEEEDLSISKVQSNLEEPYQELPQMVAIPTQRMDPWTMLPPESSYGYDYQ